MARPKKWKIKEDVRSDGTSIYKVSVTVNGQPRRKRFETYEEAFDFLNDCKQDEARIKNKSQLRSTYLEPVEIKDAEQAYGLLKKAYPDADKDLVWAVQFTLQNFKEATVPTTFEAIEGDFLEWIAKRRRKRVYRDYKNLLKRLKEYYVDKRLDSITTEDMLAFIKSWAGGSPAPKTWNNYKGQFKTIFEWCSHKSRRYSEIPTPAEDLPYFEVTYGAPVVLTVEEAEEVMGHAESFRNGEIASLIALCLFAGIRPDPEDGEILKLARRINDVRCLNLKTNIISLDAGMTKNNQSRVIGLKPNLIAWLNTYHPSKHPMLPENLSEKEQSSWLDYRIKGFRRSCPIKLSHDVLRHTFATFRAAGEPSLVDYLEEAGHTEKVAKEHYLRRVTSEDAKRFWNITPASKNDRNKGC